MRELHDRLVASIPEQQGAGIVHGDYRLDNCIMAGDGSVAAVLDWELCTLGDVLMDVAGLVTWWGDPNAGLGRLSEMPTTVDGFGPPAAVLERYGRRSDRDLSSLDWYVALQFWRVACIIEGCGCATPPARWATSSTTTTAEPGCSSTTRWTLRRAAGRGLLSRCATRSPPSARSRAMRDQKYDILFEPAPIGPLVAKNRFFQVPHCNGMGYRDPAACAEMRAVKAQGGWAVVCTEEVEVHYTSEVTPTSRAASGTMPTSVHWP